MAAHEIDCGLMASARWKDCRGGEKCAKTCQLPDFIPPGGWGAGGSRQGGPERQAVTGPAQAREARSWLCLPVTAGGHLGVCKRGA